LKTIIAGKGFVGMLHNLYLFPLLKRRNLSKNHQQKVMKFHRVPPPTYEVGGWIKKSRLETASKKYWLNGNWLNG
jgi:hypothetical protein